MYNSVRVSRPADFVRSVEDSIDHLSARALSFVQSGVLDSLPFKGVQKLLQFVLGPDQAEIVRKLCAPSILPLLEVPSNCTTLAQVTACQSLGVCPSRSCLEWVIRSAHSAPTIFEEIMVCALRDSSSLGKYTALFDGMFAFSILAVSPIAVRFFLKNGADPNLPVRDGGLTPLHLAMEIDPPIVDVGVHGCFDVIEALVQAGAMLETRNFEGNTPLFHAAKLGKIHNLQFLLSKFSPNMYSHSTVSILGVCTRPPASVVAHLPLQVVNEEVMGSSRLPFLHYWLQEHRYQPLTQILPKRTDWDLLVPNRIYQQSFLRCVADDVIEDDLVALLAYIPKYAPQLTCAFLPILAAGLAKDRWTPRFDVSKENLKPLIAFAKDRDSGSFNIDNREHSRLSRTLLHEACFAGDTGVIRCALAAGASVSLLDSDGRTPLILLALSRANISVAVLVLRTKEAGLLSHKDSFGKDALTYFEEQSSLGSAVRDFAFVADIDLATLKTPTLKQRRDTTASSGADHSFLLSNGFSGDPQAVLRGFTIPSATATATATAPSSGFSFTFGTAPGSSSSSAETMFQPKLSSLTAPTLDFLPSSPTLGFRSDPSFQFSMFQPKPAEETDHSTTPAASANPTVPQLPT